MANGYLVIMQHVENYKPGNIATDDYWQQNGVLYFFSDLKSAEEKKTQLEPSIVQPRGFRSSKRWRVKVIPLKNKELFTLDENVDMRTLEIIQAEEEALFEAARAIS